MAQDAKLLNQTQLWEKICKDEYMAYAIEEAYKLFEEVLKSLVREDVSQIWYVLLYRGNFLRFH